MSGEIEVVLVINIKNIIVVVFGKGGVGKLIISINLVFVFM